MSKKTVRRFDQFRSEAGATQPYPLALDEHTTVEIPAPTAGQILDLAEVTDRPREALKILLGDHYEAVYAVVKNEDIDTFNAFLADLTAHFGMSDSPSGSGGS